MLSATLSEPIPLQALVSTGASNLYGRVRLYNAAGALVETLSLAHVADGLYSVSHSFGTEGYFAAVFAFFTDEEMTTPADIDIGAEQVRVTSAAGLGSGAGQLTVTVDDGTDPIAAALVQLRDAASSALLASAHSDAAGQVVFAHGGGSLRLLVSRSGFNFPVTALSLDAAEVAAETVSGAAIVVTPAVDPALCTLYATLRKLDGDPREGATGTARIAYLPQDIGGFVSEQLLSATSDAAGLISWTVPRGAHVAVEVASHFGKRVTVPDEASADLGAL
jgi:hypothetical protein